MHRSKVNNISSEASSSTIHGNNVFIYNKGVTHYCNNENTVCQGTNKHTYQHYSTAGSPSREKSRIYRKDDALNKFQESIFGPRRCNIDSIHIYSFRIQFHTTLTFFSNVYLKKIFQAIECFIIHFKFIMCMGQRYATIHMHHIIYHDNISFKFFHF